MKILRVTPILDPEMGGPQTTIVNAAIAERRCGLEPTIVFVGDDRSLVSTAPARARLEAAGVPALMFPRMKRLRSLAARWGISHQMTAWLLRNARHYSIIHVDYVWAWSTLIAAIAGTRAARPVVMTAHESLTRFDIQEKRSRRYKAAAKLCVRRLLMRYVDVVVMTSDLECDDSMGTSEHTVVVPHPVADNLPDSPAPEPPYPPLMVGYIGRLHPKKNVDVLLRAVAGLTSSAKLTVCGEGAPDYRTYLYRLADELSLAPHVDWRGHVDAGGRAQLFAESHVIAMPSMYECFGMAAAEAMAAGVPVIVSTRTGVAPVVERHGCGKLVEPDDVDGLRIALADAASDAIWRHQARVSALTAAATFSYDSYGERMTALYAKLIAESSISSG